MPDRSDVTYRLATADDVERTWDVFVETAAELRTRQHRPPFPATPERRARALAVRHLTLAVAPGGFWIAEATGQQVDFAIANERDADRAALAMPGHCRPGVAYLLERGFKLGHTINLLLASRP